MPRFKGRSVNACLYCRSQKVKCSGEQPCTKCRSSRRACVYSSREKVMTVPESYVRRLENEVAQLRPPIRPNQSPSTHPSHPFTTPQSNELGEQRIPDRLIENSTTEHFVRKLKGVYCTRSQDASGVSPLSTGPTPYQPSYPHNDDQSISSDYTYIPLDHDVNQPKVFVKLPPHSYAIYLLGQFESFMGSDYHWYKKKCFRAKIEATYDSSQPQTVDRTWLCCFSVVLALGESYNDGVAPSFFIENRTGLPTESDTPDSQQTTPPGIEFFKQALLLFRPSYEEPTIEQVEALNLITFYCYSLNRRRTAYAYAGMALRLANLLGLPKSTAMHSPVEQAHRKHIWWTTICMDIMTCTELSLNPSYALGDDTSSLPSYIDLPVEEAGEFSDPRYLTAQVKLVRIKYHITKAIPELRYGNSFEAHAVIEPLLQSLKAWKTEFSPNLEFQEDGTFSAQTVSTPEMRTIASILLRYNQCLIILLRPLLLKQLQDLVHDNSRDQMSTNELETFNTQCLQAAANNTAIQFALSKCHKVAKFGFWESLHIFSSLTVHIISRFILEKCPTAFTSVTVDAPFGPVRDLLEKMARTGNAASKDHERMINEIQNVLEERSSSAGLLEGIGDFGEWSNYLDSQNMGFVFDETFPVFGWS